MAAGAHIIYSCSSNCAGAELSATQRATKNIKSPWSKYFHGFKHDLRCGHFFGYTNRSQDDRRNGKQFGKYDSTATRIISASNHRDYQHACEYFFYTGCLLFWSSTSAEP